MISRTRGAVASYSTLALALFLAACGGGGDSASAVSASEPAKLATTDEVAALVTGFVALGEVDFDISGSTGASAANPASSRAAKSFRPKATTTENCDSGSISFTDDASTLFSDDGLTTANSCRFTFNEGGASFTSSVNGKSSDRCTDSAQTANDCEAYAIRVGDGAAGSATLDLAFVGGSGASREDFEVRFKADLTDTLAGNTSTTQLTGTIAFNDRVEQLAGTALFENIQVAFTLNPNTGGGSETLSGNFGLSAGNGKCSIGKVSLRTDSPLIYNSNFDVTAGQLTLTGANGQTARVNYNSDGSYTVTLANGQTRTYAASDDFEALC